MAYDVEFATPRGRIGFNVGYSQFAQNVVATAWVQQSDGSWKGVGIVGVAGDAITGAGDVVMLNCLIAEGILPAGSPYIEVAGWIARTPQEEVLKVLYRWLARAAIKAWAAFVNRALGVVPGAPLPEPGQVPAVQYFASSEHALRVAFKSAIWTVNPVTSEVSVTFPA